MFLGESRFLSWVNMSKSDQLSIWSQMGSWEEDGIWKAKLGKDVKFTQTQFKTEGSDLVNSDTCIYGKKETHFLNTTILGSIKSLAQTFNTQFSRLYKWWFYLLGWPIKVNICSTF